MAEQIYNVKCGFFDAVNNDRVYTAEDMNRLYKRVIHDGVFPDENNNPSDDLLVEADSGMTIIVGTGEGVFASHWFKNSVDIPIEVPPNSSNNRIDSVIIQVDTRKSGRAGNVVYRTGEPSVNPAPPEINEVLGVVEYRLANISVTSGATAITSADITDLRGTSECPWVTGIVAADDIPPNSVTEAKLATNAVTTAKIKNRAVTGAKIATGTIETTNIGIGQIKTANIDGGAVTEDKLDTDSVTPTKIKDGAVIVGKLGVEAVREINIDGGAVTTSRIADEAITYEKLDAHSLLNTSTTSQPIYDDEHLPTAQFMQKYLNNRVSGRYSLTFGLDNIIKNYANPTILNNNSVLAGSDVYSVYVSPNVTEIQSSYASFSTNLHEIYVDNIRDNIDIASDIKSNPNINIYYQGEFSIVDLFAKSQKALNNSFYRLSDYSIGFNTGGIAVEKTTSTIMGAGTFLSGIKSIYLSENVTTLQDGFFNTASDLTDLYVDSDSVEMPTVPARVTVHNKGTFVVSDLLINSMIASNNEILDIKATITQVNTQLENAINGVSE